MPGLLDPSPIDMGFLPKFDSWRNGQEFAVETSILNNKRVTGHCAPTGFGKSLAYMTEALLTKGRVAIIVPTKGLQDQLMKDFSNVGLVVIKGKDNYECRGKAGWTCKDGHAGGCSMKGTPACSYGKAYQDARLSKLVVTSYDFWIAVHKYGLGLGDFSLAIFDESDECPDKLADSVQVKLSYHEIEEMLGLSFPKANAEGTTWKLWATEARAVAQSEMAAKKRQVEGSGSPKSSWIKDLHHYSNLIKKLAQIGLMRASDWVWEGFEWGWQFDPVRFSRYRESRLFLNIKKVSMYSATIRPKTMYMMGLKDEDVHFIDHPSVFPPERSPVYSIPTQRVDSRNPDISMLVARIDQILSPRLDLGRNGIILTTSFDYRNRIHQKSRMAPWMVSHWEKAPVTDAVARFKDHGGALISPAIYSGYDFPGDQCRFTITTKIPFTPRSKVIDARQQLDKYYGPYHAMRQLVQGTGRGTRSDKDWCENFILDDHFWQWYARAFEFLAPKSFWERYKPLERLPQVYLP